MLAATALTAIALLAVRHDSVLDETLTTAKRTPKRDGDHDLPPNLI